MDQGGADHHRECSNGRLGLVIVADSDGRPLLRTDRALNTFIDDLFSFIVRMPTMHRIGCFRDDIVFLIYLYQRHIYPEDKARMFDEDDEATTVTNNPAATARAVGSANRAALAAESKKAR